MKYYSIQFSSILFNYSLMSRKCLISKWSNEDMYQYFYAQISFWLNVLSVHVGVNMHMGRNVDKCIYFTNLKRRWILLLITIVSSVYSWQVTKSYSKIYLCCKFPLWVMILYFPKCLFHCFSLVLKKLKSLFSR